MIIRHLHEWQVSTSTAIKLQTQLASRICQDETPGYFRYIAGVDVSTHRLHEEGTAAAVVLSYPELEVLEESKVRGKVDFPYVPGLLTFREAPLILEAFRKLSITPDLVLVDGQGIAHPRRFGIAAHLGLLLDIPTIGCAKSRLCGIYEEPGMVSGDCTDLTDDDEIIGKVLRTKSDTRPVYVSVGHKISLEQAIHWVLLCCKGFRLPEPTRLAHQAAGGHLRRAETTPVV
jgi:deoxyribonuclease V